MNTSQHDLVQVLACHGRHLGRVGQEAVEVLRGVERPDGEHDGQVERHEVLADAVQREAEVAGRQRDHRHALERPLVPVREVDTSASRIGWHGAISTADNQHCDADSQCVEQHCMCEQ